MVKGDPDAFVLINFSNSTF
uniref:Uncharacterized protein n=1 Tax=Rhizophora mucronata TaxID=61149 RepID=A0A2P2PUI3_RHIMU